MYTYISKNKADFGLQKMFNLLCFRNVQQIICKLYLHIYKWLKLVFITITIPAEIEYLKFSLNQAHSRLPNDQAAHCKWKEPSLIKESWVGWWRRMLSNPATGGVTSEWMDRSGAPWVMLFIKAMLMPAFNRRHDVVLESIGWLTLGIFNRRAWWTITLRCDIRSRGNGRHDFNFVERREHTDFKYQKRVLGGKYCKV